MLTIGDTFPEYTLTGVTGPAGAMEMKTFSSKDPDKKGWSVVFFWPMTTR